MRTRIVLQSLPSAFTLVLTASVILEMGATLAFNKIAYKSNHGAAADSANFNDHA
jgi:hypothetical protein